MARRNLTDDDIELAEIEIVEQSRRIEFFVTEYSVEMLANKMHSGDYVVPPYQREFTWEPERKSRFLESVILGLPIPFLFFWEMPDGRLEIVDGSQRLRTIEEFILGDLRLGELERLTLASGFRFADLLESRQRKVLNRPIRGIILNEHADEAARLDMFDRINTGSKQANKAEVRRGALAGPFLDLVIELASSDQFIRLTPMNKKRVDEREREELVTRFFAYSDGLEGYKDRPSDFVFDYARKTNKAFEESPELESIYRAKFAKMMTFVEDVFPNGFARSATGQATPRARFEAIAVGTDAALAVGVESSDALRRSVLRWLAGDEFREITGSDGANAIGRLRNRITFVRDRLVANGEA